MNPAPVETEIKLLLEPGAKREIERHPVFAGALRSKPTRRERTIYFDTDELALRERGYSLRIRERGGRRVQTLKKIDSTSPHKRNEWEWRISGPRLALRPVGEVLGAETGLVERYRSATSKFVTEIRRRSYEVVHEGSQIEAVIDEGVVKANGHEEDVSEIELEIKNGAPGPAYRLALELLEHERLHLGTESKADRGYRLLTGSEAPAAKSRALPLPQRATLGEALQLTAGSALHDFAANVPAARAGNPEGVHQMRVALRRLRTLFVLYGPYLEPCAKARFNGAVQDMGVFLGDARDWDVFVDETLRAARQAEIPIDWIQDFEEEGASRRESAYHRLRGLIDGKAPAELVLGVQAWLCDSGWNAKSPKFAAMPVVELMPELFDRLALKIERRGYGAARRSAAKLHPLRKSIKKLRFSSESLMEMFPAARVKRHVKHARKLQKILGSINDVKMTSQLLQEIAPPHSAAWASAAGALHKWNAGRQKQVRKGLGKRWRKLKKAEPFWH